MISEYDETTGYKVNTQSYSYTHGSYVPLKDEYMFASEGSVTLTLTLHTNKAPCEYREFYIRFAEQELGRAGKLWAVKNNEIIWAYAIPRNVHQIRSNQQNRVEYDIEFLIPEGVWHKADKQKTFVLPYDICTFMECKGYKKLNPCDRLDYCEDCCDICLESKNDKWEDRCFCCCVDEITKDMALCYHEADIQKFYTCQTPYQLVYDCLHAEKFSREDFLGQKLCTTDVCNDHLITGRIYSETDIATDQVTIIIRGEMHNPWVTINDNTNIIKGDYSGALIIEPSGDVFFQASECCDKELLDPSVWTIPCGNSYGWKMLPQYNKVAVNLNRCCNGITCVFVQHDGLTT